jgi:hypothetical protein
MMRCAKDHPIGVEIRILAIRESNGKEENHKTNGLGVH